MEYLGGHGVFLHGTKPATRIITMTFRRHIRNIIAAGIALTMLAGVDIDTDQMPRLAPAMADDDGGGRSGGRNGGRNRADRGDDDGPRLFRPWRKRQTRIRRATRPAVAQLRYEPGILIARGLSASVLSRLQALGYERIEGHTLGNGTGIIRLRIPRGRSLEAARREVGSAQPGILIDFNHYYRPDAGDCVGGRCLMRQISGWSMDGDRPACGPVAPIGLIDTRINIGHPSLSGSRISVLPLFDAAAPASGEYHGTAVAALLVGSGDVPGLLPGGQILAIDAFRKGDIATGYDLARALDMLTERKVPVINMSLSGPDNAILAASVADALSRGVVVIAAAGNDGPRAKPAFPAAYPGVIAVTAVDRGRNVYRRAARGAHIDIAAPGVNVWTAASVKGQKPRSGTSFAAPFVAAAAALILADNPGFGREEVEIVLENEADDLGDLGRDDTFGWGLLDVSGLCRGKRALTRHAGSAPPARDRRKAARHPERSAWATRREMPPSAESWPGRPMSARRAAPRSPCPRYPKRGSPVPAGRSETARRPSAPLARPGT
jgi:hypothetical protein